MDDGRALAQARFCAGGVIAILLYVLEKAQQSAGLQSIIFLLAQL